MKRSDESRKGKGRGKGNGKKKEMREERRFVEDVKVLKRFKGSQVIVSVPSNIENEWSVPLTRHHKDGVIILNSQLFAVPVMIPDPDATTSGLKIVKLNEKGKPVMEIVKMIYCADITHGNGGVR